MTSVREKALEAMPLAERELAGDVRAALVGTPHFVTNDGRRVAIPAGLADLFKDLAAAAEQGETVAIRVGRPRPLTAREAAEALGVSRTTLCKLMDSGEIQGSYVGTHRRIAPEEIDRYQTAKARQLAERYAAATAGLSDVDDEPMTKISGRAPKRSRR